MAVLKEQDHEHPPCRPSEPVYRRRPLMNEILLFVNSLALVLLAWLCYQTKNLNDLTRSNLSEVRAIIVMWDLAVQTMDEHNKRQKP
jgi:hypothetical protein